MWLSKTGIQSKMLRIVKNMYAKVKSCVKSCITFSDLFEYSVGLRQGEVISPILVSSILEDLELCLQNYINSGILIGNIAIILFADDMVIFGKTAEELQTKLDLLYSYCLHWSLEVNVDKTKAR